MLAMNEERAAVVRMLTLLNASVHAQIELAKTVGATVRAVRDFNCEARASGIARRSPFYLTHS